MRKNENNYFRIDHTNSSSYIDEDYETNLTLSLFMSLASMSEESIGTELNKFFSKMISINESDLYKINLFLLSNIKKKTQLPKKINDQVNYILNSKFDMNYTFTNENVFNLSIILFESFKELSTKKKSKITSQKDFLNTIQKLNFKQIDVIKNYFNHEAVDEYNNLSVISSKSCENIFQSKFTKKRGNAFKSLISVNTDFSSLSNHLQLYKFKSFKSNEYPLPIEMIILLNKFQNIKKLTLVIESEDDYFILKNENYLIILLNVDWLFPNLIEIEINFKNYEFQEIIREIFNKKTEEIFKKAKLVNKTTNYNKEITNNKNWKADAENDSNELDIYEMKSGSFSIKNKSMFTNELNNNINENNKNQSLKKALQNNKEKIDLIILYSYFVSQWLDKIKVLNLIFSESFSREIEIYLNLSKIKLFNFHFLTFLNKISQLAQFEVTFNSLDSISFEKIIGIIHNNTKMNILRLNFFAEEIVYSPSSLYKLCNSLKMNMKQLLGDPKILSFGGFKDIDQQLCDYLLPNFEDNLEKLFFVLKNKYQLTELVIFLDIPSLICQNDGYIQLLTKFFFNLLLLINEKSTNFRIFKFIAPMLLIDSVKNSFIEPLFDSLDLVSNEKLKKLSIQMKLHKVVNVTNLISNYLQILFIGDLDVETLDAFCDLFIDENFQEESQLIEVKISLSPIILQFSQVKKPLLKYYNTKIKRIKEQSLYSSIMIQKEDYIDILNIIAYNSYLIHFFEFGFDSKQRNQDIVYLTNNIGFCGESLQKERLAIKSVVMRKMIKKKIKERVILRALHNIMQFVFWGGYKEIITKLR